MVASIHSLRARDVTGCLRIPEKLYKREREIDVLLEAEALEAWEFAACCCAEACDKSAGYFAL
jgi:hypothetical protein